jgi:hypothetical protein
VTIRRRCASPDCLRETRGGKYCERCLKAREVPEREAIEQETKAYDVPKDAA